MKKYFNAENLLHPCVTSPGSFFLHGGSQVNMAGNGTSSIRLDEDEMLC